MRIRSLLIKLVDVPTSTKVFHMAPLLVMIYFYTYLSLKLQVDKYFAVNPNWMMSLVFFTHGAFYPDQTINNYFNGKISVQLQRQLTTNGKQQMRNLGEHLRKNYNPNCLEAASFVSPVKRCNDSIFYVYQVWVQVFSVDFSEHRSLSLLLAAFQGLFNSTNVPLESQVTLPAGDDLIAQRSLIANMGSILNRVVHYPARIVNSYLQDIIRDTETAQNRLKPDTVVVDVLLSALADGQKLDSRLSNVSRTLLKDMKKAILTSQIRGFQRDLVDPVFGDLKWRLQNITDTEAVPEVNLLLFCLTPLQLAAAFKSFIRNEFSFTNVYGDAFEFKIFSGGRVVMNSLSWTYSEADSSYSYRTRKSWNQLTLDELLDNILEFTPPPQNSTSTGLQSGGSAGNGTSINKGGNSLGSMNSKNKTGLLL